MKRRGFVLSLILVMIASLFTACGGNTASPGGNGGNGGNGGGDNVTIKFLHKYVEPDRAPVFQQICDDYTAANPNVTIRVETTTDDEIKDKLRVLMGSGDMPDVFQVWSGEYTKKFIRSGNLLELTSYLQADAEYRDSFIPSALKSFTYEDDKIWGVPTRIDCQLFVYNKEQFAAAGIDKEPEVWQDLLDACVKLEAAGFTPFSFGNGIVWDAPHWYGALWGKTVPEEIMQGQDYEVTTVRIDDPGYVEALGYFKQLQPYFTPNVGSTDHEMMLQNFYNGRGSMVFLEMLEFQTIYENMGDNFGWFDMPDIPDARGEQTRIHGGPEGLCISSQTANPDITVDFVKYLTSLDSERKKAAVGHTSAKIGAMTADDFCPQLLEAVDWYLNETTGMIEWCDCGFEGRIVEILLKNGQDFIDDRLTAEEYIAKMAEAATAVREEYAS